MTSRGAAVRAGARTAHVAIIGIIGALLATLVAAGPARGDEVDRPDTSALTTTDFVTMTSEGDFVGDGKARTWLGSEVSVSGSLTDGVIVRVAGPSGGFSLWLAAPRGETLQVGSYEGARRAPFREGSEPGIDVSGDGRGCNRIAGRFDVLAASADLDRLWITFEQQCESSRSERLFGEISIGAPVDPAAPVGLAVAGRRVAWPEQYPGVSSRAVPVRIRNDGEETVEFTGASIAPGGRDDFVVLGTSCDDLEPDQTCAVYVTFKPSAPGPHDGEVRLRSRTGTVVVALAGNGIAGHTSWETRSQTGDVVGGGRHLLFTPSDVRITALGDESEVTIGLRGDGEQWSATFEADQGRVLLPGTTFDDADDSSYNDADEPGLSVEAFSGSGGSCDRTTGSFTVHEATFDATGEVETLAVTFTQFCDGSDAALRGSIAYRSDHPAPAVPIVADEQLQPASDLQVVPHVGGATLSWVDPSSSRWDTTRVVLARGSTAPTDPSDGVTVYEGREGRAELGDLPPGQDVSVTVFALDATGAPAARPPGTTLRGSLLRLARPEVRHGRPTAVRGRLTDGEGRWLTGEEVTVFVREGGSAPWQARTLVTGERGRFELVHPVAPRTQLRAVYGGRDLIVGSTTGTVRPVRP